MGLRSCGVFFSILIFLVCVSVESQQNHSCKMVIKLGSSLSAASSTPPTSWSSSSGLFAFGFYKQDTGFKVGIWLVLNRTKTVVWTANRDDPPITSINLTLKLTRNGKLVLRTEHGIEKLIANTTGSAASASMLDSGNFVLYDTDSRVIWESFNSPTDTILGGQTLSMGGQLISSLSDAEYSTGRYKLRMQIDGNLVLYPLNTAARGLDAYWASGTWMKVPKSLSLYLNQSTGTLVIINSTSLRIIKSFNPESSYKSSYNNSKTIIYRATLDFDGVFRLYCHLFDESINDFKFQIDWKAPENPCEVKGYCGLNSFCTLDDNQPYCRCIPGTDFVDPNKWSLGCETNFPRKGCESGIENDTTSFNITTMENIEWGDLPYAQESQMSIEDCKKSCLEDCYCEAADYSLDDRYCKKQSLPLMYVRGNVVGASSKLTAIFKVRIIKSEKPTLPLTPTPTPTPTPTLILVKSRKEVMLILLVTMGLLTSSCAALSISGTYIYKFRVLKRKRLLQYGNLSITAELTLHLFSYSELRKATNGFKEELGKGSFGAVYKVGLTKNNVLLHKSADTVASCCKEEPLGSTKENEAQTIKNIFPDEDDLFSGVIDGLECIADAKRGDDTEDFDLFNSVGGMELEVDDVSCAGKNDSNFAGVVPNARNVMRALQNKLLGCRKLDIHYSIPKDNPLEKDINQGTSVVSNLNYFVSNNDLHQIFGIYGEIQEIHETPHKFHFKFIEFYDVRAAEAARCALNKCNIAGKQINLGPSSPGGARQWYFSVPLSLF
ncbi:G-type lectin S-receptor-like serine/threonine-protein kinase LECRK3 [Camellia lanceoleosa]|uniref:G-type lectin S-receptor-like serine/threonine-protein kinase LECRK3 n=1 Tax=Camellia lanceoleosa TaxID=1840588 RepID=A0ACC0FAQ1_9ERIC|nr:G-type lectin S-receptor-like serine/threonine-protein kinase LECRK3 [Camellia lanceoleosa]